jgi:hypothetical protein
MLLKKRYLIFGLASLVLLSILTTSSQSSLFWSFKSDSNGNTFSSSSSRLPSTIRSSITSSLKQTTLQKSEDEYNLCNDPSLTRAEFNKATVSSELLKFGTWPSLADSSFRQKGGGTISGFWHNRINPSCPKFISAKQNSGAGIGHRLVAYSMALHIAVWFNLTFVHTSLDGGGGAHGNYNGWDSWLAFTSGEYGFDDVLNRPGITRIRLPNLGGYYTGNEIIIDKWKDIISDIEKCNVIYDMPEDQWAYDVSSTTKFILSNKYTSAMEAHLSSVTLLSGAEEAPPQQRNLIKPPPMPILAFTPKAINIAIHIRIGDQYPTSEWTQARIVQDTVLPILFEVGILSPIHIHVFAENEGASRFPTLASLPNVFFHPDMSPMDTFYHMTESDFLIMSFSSFSFAAAQVALKPLCLSQPSSDIFRMCSETSACCLHSGDCTPFTKYRVRLAAERLKRLEKCGKIL